MNEKLITDRFNEAVCFEKNGDYEKALHAYLSILKTDKNYREVYINLGSLYSRINRLSDAMKCFTKALAMGYDYITLFNIGCIFYKRSEFKKAVINLEKSRKLNKAFYHSSLVIGLCYSRLKNNKAAEINFLDVLKNKPEQRVALTALSILYYNEKRYDDAVTLLNKTISHDSSNILMRELKLNILYETGRIDETVQEIKSIKYISDGYKIYDRFISSVPVQIYNDKYGTINDKIKLLHERTENDMNSLIRLSLCYLFKGDTEKAIEYLFEAKKSNCH